VVIYLGVDDFFFETSSSPLSTESRPYFLFVGHRVVHKNFLRLLAAFGKSGLAEDFDLRVISPTDSFFSAAEAEIIAKYQLHDRVNLITSASEITLRESYAGAVAFMYPSEYEGFGLPILEAMASGTLVATSNISSMPEVGSRAAFYFDPSSDESIAESFQQIVNLSDEQRSERITLGIAHARTFTWLRCQQQMAETLHKMM
jgi:glycosyltransferase involved in cell wall biosynthesis